MSLFLPKYNAIFLHIPKCAGQSIEKALGFKHHHKYHKVNDLPDDLEKYFRFTFARHPARRFISACKYNLRVAISTRHQLERSNFESLSPTKKYRLHLLSSNATFSSITNDLISGNLRHMLTFMPQQHWLSAGKPQFIGRVENIDTDFLLLSNIFNASLKLKRTNESDNNLELGSLSRKDFRRIAAHYKDDFKTLGYSPKYSIFDQ